MTGSRDREPASEAGGASETSGARRWSARALLPANNRAPFAARRMVSTLLLVWGCGERIELAELLVSELVSNSVRYAADAGDIEIEIIADDGVIQLSVADGSPEYPVLRDDPQGDRRGLGLHLVDRVALRWGVEEYVLGKRVWLELPV